MKEYTLPDGWKYVPLGTIADVINGVSFKPEDVKKQGIRILRSGNIQNGYLVLKDDDVFLDDSYYNEKNTLRYLDNCITASTGSIEVLGKCGTVFKEMPNCQIGAFMRLVRSKAKENAFYISFILHSPLYYQYIRRLSKNGTSINNINNNHLEDFIFPLPPQKLKEGISRWYYSIEKKISLNTRMNAELEAMVKQLYDYWFVQFDFPFDFAQGKPDENGKPYKSSGGKMVWNEKLKREIPEGWEVKEIGEVLDLLKDGTHNPPKRVEKGIPLLTGTMFGEFFIKHSEATYITEDDYNVIHKQYKPQVGDIILTKIGTIGNVNYLKKNDIPIAIHCNSALLRFPKTYGMVYPLFLCKSDYFKVRLKALKGQSVQEFVSLEKINSVLIEIPPIQVITAFNDKINSVFQEIINISEELEYLTLLRDSLLPMLMNGQVTIE